MLLADDLFLINFDKLHVTALMIVIAIVGTAIPILLVFKSMNYISETEAAILSVSEPIFSLIISYFIMNENINLVQMIGIILVVTSSIIVQLR